MSGIAGIVSFDGGPVAPGAIEAMTRSMAHRGPDGIHHWQRPNVALGQCILRTTPEALDETLPLCSDDQRFVLVMDGRVDNWEELRCDLLKRGARLRTRADAELVLRSYETWGEDCVEHIDGDFALAIWDVTHKKLFCARDRMGNKPFYWSWHEHTLVFASEPQSVLGQMPEAMALDEGMVAEYLAATFVSFTDTLWKSLKRLAPSHLAAVGPTGPVTRRYWTPALEDRIDLPNVAAFTSAYRALLEDVVRRLSRSLQPIAIEVSGGLDSSAVFAVAHDLQRRGILRAPNLEGFTLNFEGDAGADEIAHCRAVGAHLGRHVHEVTPSAMPWSWYSASAERFCDFPDYPNGAAMGVPLALAARSAGARVLLNGLGGDQWLCGSPLQLAEALQTGDLATAHRLIRETVRTRGVSRAVWALLRQGLAPLLPKAWRGALRTVRACFSADESAGDLSCLAPRMRRLSSERSADFATQISEPRRVGQRGALGSLYDAYQVMAIELAERELARQGLELRQPFWNHRMVAFRMATPGHLLLRSGVDKWLHREALQGLLPSSVLQRSDKAEFSCSFAEALSLVPPAHMESVLARRGDWVNAAKMRAAHNSFRSANRTEWDMAASWSVWGLLGADQVAQSARKPLHAPILPVAVEQRKT